MKHFSPSAESQIKFLQNIQQLFEEGKFTATYKFALLMALTELAVENWDRTIPELRLSITQIAVKFVEFYWPQSAKYRAEDGDSIDDDGILFQNLGRQASIVNIVCKLRSRATSITEAKNLQEWNKALLAIAKVVRSKPIEYLQIMSANLNPFLYDLPAPREGLVLKPDAAANLARYQGLIQQLARSAWVDHIRTNKGNEPYLGKKDDLKSFMFGTSRTTLIKAKEVLMELGENKCFYCNKPLKKDTDVDHFIPWSKYPRDLAHNFVLSHPACNRSKSDMLPARTHLDKWISRNMQHGDYIQTRMGEAGILTDLSCIMSVARWAYEQGIEVQAHAWMSNNCHEKISSNYMHVFI